MNNYYLPAEWQKQYAVQLTWPHASTDWHTSGLLSKVTDYFTKLSETILNYQNLIIVADNENVKANISALLNKKYNFHYHIYVCPSNDTWARDHGPITMLDKAGHKKIMDFNFNAWGSKFNFTKDNKITSNLHKQAAYKAHQYEKINYILEGGAIDSNGQGTVLTTASCVLNPNRNYTLSKQQQISELKRLLNIENLIILENSFLYGDDTDGHIDNLARFIDPQTIVYSACDNTNNPNYVYLEKMKNELISLQNSSLKGISLVPLFIPDPIYNIEHKLLPASYANFLIINNAVLVPIYNDKKRDRQALDTLKKLLPQHDIIGIDSELAINQGGSLHCLTMQVVA